MAERAFARPRIGSLYDVLRVTPRAEPEVIQASYRVLARLYHPDVSSDPNSASHMRELNAAYDVLRDPDRRAKYDAERTWTAQARREKRPGRTIVGRTASSPLAGYATTSSAMHKSAGFRGRFALVVALLVTLTLLFWLIFEMLSDRPASLFLA